MRLLVFLLVLAGSLGCASDPVEPPKAGNVTRAWQLTRCQYVAVADPATTVDLIAAGWVIHLYINDNHAFAYAAIPPGGQQTDVTGTWRIDGDNLILTPAGVAYEWSFRARVQEETMTLRGASAEYDFNGDGTPEAATWNMAMHH